MKTLIVDDEIVSRKMLSVFLSNYGECVSADDGEAAIYEFKQALADKNPFQLICLDIMMPKIDGHRALKEIRYLEKRYELPIDQQTKVIMTSSLNDSNSANEAFFRGHADAYLIKPVNIQLLAKELKRLNLIK